MSSIGIVGGTGLDQLAGLDLVQTHTLETPYGEPSRPVEEGRLNGVQVFFLHRHGAPEAIPPHLVNYRANLYALKSLGVGRVIGVNAVGGIHPRMRPGNLVIPDQIIDYTWGREHTVDDGTGGALQHIDFTHPYDPDLRQSLIDAARANDVECHYRATHGVTQGPRLETAAEIVRMERDGCDIVGMTGMPEAALAKELGLAYAALCMVVNPAAGKSQLPISLEHIREILEREAVAVARLLGYIVEASA